MELDVFSESNCYYSCIINAGAFLNIDYKNTFINLWSETDFNYDPNYNIFITKRMIKNFDILGAKLEILDCSSKDASELSLSSIPINNWIIIGMDSFYIPWTPYYSILNNSHYFLIKKISEKGFFCLDPTYNIKNINISFEEITSNAFDICYMKENIKGHINYNFDLEAKEIISSHPQILEDLTSKIQKCKPENYTFSNSVVKYIDALIDNRHLYKYYFENLKTYSDDYKSIFDEDFFLQWQALKNGLYKASLIKDNNKLISEICTHLNTLIDREIKIAEKILSF